MFNLEEALDRLGHSLTNHPIASPGAIAQIEDIRESAKQFGVMILCNTPPSREQSLAITKLEEAVMWAVKSIAVNQETES